MMEILAYKGTSLISRIIRLQSRSAYSHVAVKLPNGTVIEAWGLMGVRHVSSPTEAHKPGTEIDEFEVNVPFNEELVMLFLNSQLGKKYDYRGVVRFLTRRASPADNRWFCSELVMEAFKRGGVDLLKRIPASYVSPRDIVVSPLLTKLGD